MAVWRSLWTASICPASNEARSSPAESDEEGRVVRDLRRKETTGNVCLGRGLLRAPGGALEVSRLGI